MAITTIVKLTNYGKTNCETKHTELQQSETSNRSLCFFHQDSHHCGPHLAMNVSRDGAGKQGWLRDGLLDIFKAIPCLSWFMMVHVL